jgi:prolyl 4-hydroxylase
MSSFQLLDERINLTLIKDFLTMEQVMNVLNEAFLIGFKSSTVVTAEGPVTHPNRTSSSCMFSKSSSPTIREIEEKACLYAGCKLDDLEGLQLVKYEDGQRYDTHYDYFTHDYTEEIEARGQRIKTILVYLITPQKDGGTYFPKLDFMFKGENGDAVMWDNCCLSIVAERIAESQGVALGSRKENPLSEHGGMPVTRGTKIAMNIWVRESLN